MKKINNHIIKEHSHSEDTSILMKKLNNFSKKGVIHVGGHKGEEYEEYKKNGFEKIIFIEANPSLCEEMQDKFKSDPNVSVYNYIISDKNEVLDFHIHESNNGVQSSSVLKMDQLEKIVTSMYTSKTIKVQSVTLETLFEKEDISITDYNVVVSDVQGLDFWVLKGLGKIIKFIEAIIVEVQCIPLYEKFISEEEIDNYLVTQGFEREFTIYHELYKGDNRFPAWGEALFIKTKR